jgi:quercetin dioxygenase-like cupin family protein
MAIDVKPVPRPVWAPVPYEGCRNVQSKGLLRHPQVAVAMLRFGKNGTIHEHAAPFDIDVVCLDGRGLTSLAGEQAALSEGQQVRWPAGVSHCLWTEDDEMVTLMVEHVGMTKPS